MDKPEIWHACVIKKLREYLWNEYVSTSENNNYCRKKSRYNIVEREYLIFQNYINELVINIRTYPGIIYLTAHHVNHMSFRKFFTVKRLEKFNGQWIHSIVSRNPDQEQLIWISATDECRKHICVHSVHIYVYICIITLLSRMKIIPFDKIKPRVKTLDVCSGSKYSLYVWYCSDNLLVVIMVCTLECVS